MNGFFTLHMNKGNISTNYEGAMQYGHYKTGIFTSFFQNGTIQMLGQYKDNWKIGFWTINEEDEMKQRIKNSYSYL